jgi:hypothetical protein
MNMFVPKRNFNAAEIAIDGFHEIPFDTPEARVEASRLSAARRQEMVLGLLVRYPHFRLGFEHVRVTHMPVAGGEPRRGGVACLLGDTRAGKTSIVKAYMAAHPPYVGEFGEIYPCVYVAATASTTTSTLTDAFYAATVARAMAPSVNVTTRTINVINRLVMHGNELAVIDDVQYMLVNRTKTEVARFTSFVRSLIDARQFAIQLVGEEEPVVAWMKQFPELSGRGFRRQVIKPFGRSPEGQIDYQLLMADVDDRLPFLLSSELGDAIVAAELYEYSDGYLGRTMELLREACWTAISNGDSRITFGTLRDKCREMAWQDGQPEYFGPAFMKRYQAART